MTHISNCCTAPFLCSNKVNCCISTVDISPDISVRKLNINDAHIALKAIFCLLSRFCCNAYSSSDKIAEVILLCIDSISSFVEDICGLNNSPLTVSSAFVKMEINVLLTALKPCCTLLALPCIKSSSLSCVIKL